MKILYARTQFWFNLKSGGSVGHTLGVLRGFKKNSCRVKIISNERFLGIDDFNFTAIEPKIHRSASFGELLYNFYAKREFRKEISSFKPDFVYHRYTGYTFFVAKIAQELNIPLILEFNSFTTWMIKYGGGNKNILKRFIRRYLMYHIVKKIENYNLQKASLIVTVSQPLKSDLLKIGISEGKILVNPNGVDIEKFNPEIEKTEKCKQLKASLEIDDNKIVVGFSGTFGLWHGIPQLTEAIDNILSKKLLSNIHFLIMGEGYTKAERQLRDEMIKRLSKYKDITFTGVIPYSEIQYYLATCDILLSPHCPQVDGREFFGSPTKLFEYMAMGKGIVASNLAQIGEVLKHKQSAILVTPGDVEELVKGILKLVEDEELRKQLGKKAREVVISNYTWEKNTERVIDKMKINNG